MFGLRYTKKRATKREMREFLETVPPHEINDRDLLDFTLLHWVASTGFVELAEMLISNGADVNAKTRLKWSILYIAALHGHTEMIKMLISHGADINARNKPGVTPLRIAASRGKRKAFNLLKELGGEGF